MKKLLRPLLATALALLWMSANAAEAPRPAVEIVTSAGSMTVELFPDKAPQSVENFLDLVDAGFYEGTIFHRVIAGFMIQAGGYDAALAYRAPPRTVVNESANGLRNERWTLALARHSDPDSADSQFYINMNDNAHLDATPEAPGYTVFGRLVDGHAVAEDIELAETGIVGGRAAVPLEPITIIAARRIASGD